ncbi:uncharacterized protein K460DRAFT_124282 [Cucurbitaria berberidis CBS 394.84]|uniref:Homeobox domain-containing protein n=1 Tax=Cucurbitaria berberidis CBS 394.84 TaxID=1168544 RepID=A0A9P4L8S3_9PLEO|nr:uncharacterized protein K460DRAFT_124282 [Cucurbitaria berberidis CBS 394.84]KAF1846411.1 hypothetical protein K460DRAFT_124282 [Cucurbitaria berberidis CBS 394.84]
MALDWSLPAQPDEFDDLFNFDAFGGPQCFANENSYVPPSWFDGTVSIPDGISGLDDLSIPELEESTCPVYPLQIDSQQDLFSNDGLPCPQSSASDLFSDPTNILVPSQDVSSFHPAIHNALDPVDTRNFPTEDDITEAKCVNDRVEKKPERPTTTAKRRGTFQEESKTGGKSKHRRTKISPAARNMLEQEFLLDPYPSDHIAAVLSSRTGLDTRAIKNWFSNARSRKNAPEQVRPSERQNSDLHTMDIGGIIRDVSPVSNVSAANLDALDRVSPTPSSSSLERYLATPASEEALPFGALGSHIRTFGLDVSQTSRLFSDTFSPMRAFSTAGSESSAGSAISIQSWSSRISIDSRGSRRGRKRWTRPSVKSELLQPAELLPPISDIERLYQDQTIESVEMCPPPPKRRAIDPDISKRKSPMKLYINPVPEETNLPESCPAYFCTWPNCSITFQHRFEWVRHEEAVHYNPYHWVCCSDRTHDVKLPECYICGRQNDVTIGHIVQDHFPSCVDKPQPKRTFLRQDQLAQHIKRVHLKLDGVTQTVPKWLLEIWKSDNPQLRSSPFLLRCGFCGTSCSNWAEREEHVAKHLKDRTCKLSWWPDRAPAPTALVRGNRKFACPTCGLEFISATVAAQLHPKCESWSCRYLHDMHSSFETSRSAFEVLRSECRLCDFEVGGVDKEDAVYIDFLTSHAESHALRTCDQKIFLDWDKFTHHLHIHHRASYSRILVQEQPLLAWGSVQYLERYGTQILMRTLRMLEENDICPSRQHGYTTEVVGELDF